MTLEDEYIPKRRKIQLLGSHTLTLHQSEIWQSASSMLNFVLIGAMCHPSEVNN